MKTILFHNKQVSASEKKIYFSPPSGETKDYLIINRQKSFF